MVMIFLILLYTLLQFAIIILENQVDPVEFASISAKLNYLELAILAMFLLEILINMGSYGAKVRYMSVT